MSSNLMDRILRYDDSRDWVISAHRLIDILDDPNGRRLIHSGGVDSSASVDRTARVEPGCYVGPGARIGLHCSIKMHAYVGAGCMLDYSSEVAAAVVLPETRIAHMACVSHAVIGPDCKLAYGFVVASRHLYDRPIRVHIDAYTSYFSPVIHHGAVVGARVHTGVYVATMPGATIAADARVNPRANIAGWHSA